MAGKICATFNWKIFNLFTTDQCAESPEFYVNSLRKSGWTLRLNIPSSLSKEVTICLVNKYYKQDSGSPGLLSINFEISILAVNSMSTITHFQENISFSTDSHLEVHGFPSWYTLTQTNKGDYLPDGILTIQCQLRKRNVKHKDLTPLFYQACTRLGIRKISFDWSLKLSDLKEGGEIQKNRFYLDRKQPIFSVAISTASNQNVLGFNIEQNNNVFRELKLSCKISVLDAVGNISAWKEGFTKLKLNEMFQCPQFINIKDLRENSEIYLNDNKITLAFDFIYETDDEAYSVVESISKFPPQSKPSIQSQSIPSFETAAVVTHIWPWPFFPNTPNPPEKKTNADAYTSKDKESDSITQAMKDSMHDLYLSNSWSDVVLEAEGRSFPCHKCILSSRSPVFHSLLSESSTYTLGLELKASVLGSMLLFIYTGDIGIQMDFQNALELYEAATEYKVIFLKNVCSKYLVDNINDQNACDILVLASKLRDITLKTKIEDFILKREKSILCSGRWKDLVKSDAKHIVETMHRIYLGNERGIISDCLLWTLDGAAISDYIAKSTVEHQSNFLSIYKSSLFSDFKLCTKNRKTFAAHKNILWARSPVFKAMLSSNIKESSMSTLDIPDMDEQTLEQFLRFLYSGKIEAAELEELSKLYFSADKYQILSLKEGCSKSLVSALSLKNVCDILILSDKYRDEKFKNEVLDFLAKNDEKVILSPEWKNIMKTNSQLVSETVYQIYSRKANLNSANSEIESEKSRHLSESNHKDFSEIDAETILQVDLVSLYEEKCFSDCKLCTNDRTFEVHKNILCARSPVFNAMFSSNLEEATTNTLVIPDLDGETVDKMLRYVYTGTFEDTESVDLCQLYYAADKYQINSLKDWCSHLLSEKISVENVCEILLLANRHGDKGLDKSVQNFFIKNSKEVFKSDNWKALMLNEPQVSCQTMLFLFYCYYIY